MLAMIWIWNLLIESQNQWHVVVEEDEEKLSVELSVTETPRDDKMERFLLSSKCALECEKTSRVIPLTSDFYYDSFKR